MHNKSFSTNDGNYFYEYLTLLNCDIHVVTQLHCPIYPAIGPPERTSLTIINDTTMYLSWEEPIFQQETVLGYKYTCYSNTITVQQETLSDPNVRSAIITGGSVGLSPYTLYTCDVTGFGNSSQGATASISRRSSQNRETFSAVLMCMKHIN